MHTEKQMERLDRYVTIAKNAFWFYPFKGICFVCDRPTFIGMDAEWRLHAIDRPAIEFSDGWKLYYVHGVEVPEFVIKNPEKITTQLIDDEKNAEVRRVMLEIYGVDRYLRDITPIHQDRYGILYRKEYPDDSPLCMVRALNSTPEPDGALTIQDAIHIFGQDTVVNDGGSMRSLMDVERDHPDYRFKEYFIGVPTDMKTAHEAIAWTFYETPDTYAPEIES